MALQWQRCFKIHKIITSHHNLCAENPLTQNLLTPNFEFADNMQTILRKEISQTAVN